MEELFRNDLISKFGKYNFLKVQSVSIGIAGCGGLGSNLAVNLVRSGFKNLIVADYDRVEPSNLDRQFYFSDQIGKDKVDALEENLLRINSDLNVTGVGIKIEKDNAAAIFKDCSIVAECLDRVESKSMLVSELMKTDKFIVAASGLGGIGSSDEIMVHKIRDNFIMVGDLDSDVIDKPAISPRVNIAAAKQADVILEYVIKHVNM